RAERPVRTGSLGLRGCARRRGGPTGRAREDLARRSGGGSPLPRRRIVTRCKAAPARHDRRSTMTTEQSTIGWIGAGRMGHAMAQRLLIRGHHVTVWNRTRSKAADLADLGATIADRIAELSGCRVVFTMVSADADLEEVLLGDGGLLRQEEAPAILVDS